MRKLKRGSIVDLNQVVSDLKINFSEKGKVSSVSEVYHSLEKNHVPVNGLSICKY